MRDQIALALHNAGHSSSLDFVTIARPPSLRKYSLDLSLNCGELYRPGETCGGGGWWVGPGSLLDDR